MKKKLFASLGLGMLLAVGGAAMIGNGQVKAAKATPSDLRFYLNASACVAPVANPGDPAIEKFALYYFGGGLTATFVDTTADTDKPSILYADVPAQATTIIVVRYDATQTASWDSKWNQTADIGITDFNYIHLDGYDGEGKITYTTSRRAKVVVRDGDHQSTIKGVDFYNISSTDPYYPQVAATAGKYAKYYEDSGLHTEYVAAKVNADTTLYMVEADFENTATLYVKKYGSWADHKLYVWETIGSVSYYLRGGFDQDSTKMGSSEVYNVTFDGDGMFKISFKYHDAANVKMILHDGTDNNKSETANFVNETFVKFDSENPGHLECNADLFLGADMAYAICSKMTETGVSTNYGERDYTVCALKNNATVKADIIAKYNALRSNATAKAAFDAATLNTYVYGDGDEHFVNYGQVSFVNVINEIAGYDIVTNAVAPAAFSLTSDSNSPFLALIIGGGVICLGAAALLISKKRKLAK